MNEQVFTEYADLTRQIKALEVRQDEIKPQVEAELGKVDGELVKGGFGTFSFRTTKKWAYSDVVKTLELSAKDQKKKEEENGTATATESKSLVFRLAEATDGAN